MYLEIRRECWAEDTDLRIWSIQIVTNFMRRDETVYNRVKLKVSVYQRPQGHLRTEQKKKPRKNTNRCGRKTNIGGSLTKAKTRKRCGKMYHMLQKNQGMKV